jgi:hypothetical protein
MLGVITMTSAIFIGILMYYRRYFLVML